MPIWYWTLKLDQSSFIKSQLQVTDQAQFSAHDDPSLGFHALGFYMRRLCLWIVRLNQFGIYISLVFLGYHIATYSSSLMCLFVT